MLAPQDIFIVSKVCTTIVPIILNPPPFSFQATSPYMKEIALRTIRPLTNARDTAQPPYHSLHRLYSPAEAQRSKPLRLLYFWAENIVEHRQFEGHLRIRQRLVMIDVPSYRSDIHHSSCRLCSSARLCSLRVQ